MANKTDKTANTVHGGDPQSLVEKIVRQRIYNNIYWKEQCFGLRVDKVLEKAVKLEAVGGTYGGYRKPTKFLCLVLKLLQLQPDVDSILELIYQEDFKYVRVLAAFYLRMVGNALQIYKTLEPLLNDYRKIRLRKEDGRYEITYVDELVDQMLIKNNMFDCTLPRIPPRRQLEAADMLQPLLGGVESEDDDEDEAVPEPPPLPPPGQQKRRRSSSEDLD